MTFVYEFNLDGAKLMWRNLCDKVNGNDKLIKEYFIISGQLLDAIKNAKSKSRKQKLRREYYGWSESKVVPLGRNRYELQGYNAGMATRAQNYAKVMRGRAILAKFALEK